MYCPQGVKIVLVGNKVDLENDARAVTMAEGREFAEEGGYAFFETSAKMNVGVEEAFRELVTRIVQSEHQNPADFNTHSRDRVQIVQNDTPKEESKGCCWGIWDYIFWNYFFSIYITSEIEKNKENKKLF